MTDAEATACIIRQGDGLAEQIMSVEVPEIATYRALNGLVNLAAGTDLFTVPARWRHALRRLPAEDDLAAWAAQERRLGWRR